MGWVTAGSRRKTPDTTDRPPMHQNRPVPSLTKAQLRHTQSELVTFPAQRRLWPDSILGTEQPERSNDQTR
jgi:hypothetical protein